MNKRLELSGITKVYPSVVANQDVSLSVDEGEIHAVLGENGAGKSTLMKIIYGLTRPTAGQMVWEGQVLWPSSPAQARSLGIGMVFQHFSLFESLTVVENIALAMPGKLDTKTLAGHIAQVSQHYGLPLDPQRLVHRLSVGERQRVEIVRALLLKPRLLIMDEPTSVLTPSAVDTLFETLRQLSAEGVSILYISHKLDEIQRLCHSATVLRQGRVSGHCKPAEETPQSLARLMIGQDLPHIVRPPLDSQSEAKLRFEVRGVSQASADPFGVSLKNIQLKAYGGQILGIAGISGNGQNELMALLSGERLSNSGGVWLDGQDVSGLDAGQRRDAGLGCVPEDRMAKGVVPGFDLVANSLLTAHRQGLVRHGLIQRPPALAFADAVVAAFKVKTPHAHTPAGSLSGGNVQKFIVGREMQQNPSVLILAQPTWGVDVGAAALIRQALVSLKQQGAAVVVISEELDELFEIADSLAVMFSGRLSHSMDIAQCTAESVGLMMGGQGMEQAA